MAEFIADPTSVRQITGVIFVVGNTGGGTKWPGYICHLKRTPWVPKNRLRMDTMAASSTTGFLIPTTVQSVPAVRTRTKRRRQITPRAGHAIEILGHAIEYLTDEFVNSGATFSSHDSQLEAVQLLMARNREVYFACPEIPSLAERFHAFFNRGLI
jgi:hypothetical protein